MTSKPVSTVTLLQQGHTSNSANPDGPSSQTHESKRAITVESTTGETACLRPCEPYILSCLLWAEWGTAVSSLLPNSSSLFPEFSCFLPSYVNVSCQFKIIKSFSSHPYQTRFLCVALAALEITLDQADLKLRDSP